jgi:hypothetical protein
MRAVNTVVDRQSLPTLAELGGPELDHSEMLPANFQWPDAKPSLDQGSCGACWAFASVATLNDRFTIWSDLRVDLSPFKMLVCNMGGLEHELNFGDSVEQVDAEREALLNFECRGNTLADAWRYLFVSGVPEQACVDSRALGLTCTEVVGFREDQCPTGVVLRTFRCRAYYSVPAGDVAREIYQRGPVSAAFGVASNFWDFDFSRVYEPEGPVSQGHAVRIIGWGESKKEGKWWVVVNSFGPRWGMNGMFRMRRGFLETNVITGLPDMFGEGPLFANKSDLYFRGRLGRVMGLDDRTGKFTASTGKRPQFYGQALKPKTADLNLKAELFEDTHAGFRIAIFVIGLVSLCVWLWRGRKSPEVQ